jgi:hypothetical protein
MNSNYTKVFVGNRMEALYLKTELEAIGIEPVIKDEHESGLRAGFGAGGLPPGSLEVFVHNDELEKAKPVLDKVISGLNNKEDDK